LRKLLLFKLTALVLVVTLLSVGVATFFVSLYSQRSLYANLENDLKSNANMIRFWMEDMDPEMLQARIVRLGTEMDRRITIVDSQGVVLADSAVDPEQMHNLSDRPEFEQALAGRVGTAQRTSETTGDGLLYAAVPLPDGAVRVAMDADIIDVAVGSLLQGSLAIALLVLASALGVGFVISRHITDPLNDLLVVTRQLQAGEFGRRVLVRTTDEIGLLGKAFNELSQTLEKMFNTIHDREGKLNAVLTSMDDGVLAVNMQRKVILANRTVAETTGLDEESLIGKDQVEVIRNLDLANILNETMGKEKTVNEEIKLNPASERIVAVTSSPLEAEDGSIIGAVAVLRDVTNLRKLETMRQEFVANVSHELRTPITSIKGFIETLLNSDLEDKQMVDRFLRIVNGETDRMITLINDLLDLSRIESGKQLMKLESTNLRDVFQGTLDVLQSKAELKGVSLANRIPEDILVKGDAKLLRQVAMNLVDNSIKYNQEGGHVWVDADVTDSRVEVTVADDGVGIPKDHVNRVFERFYRVDKGRSRNMGGTGLGLSIVRHIVEKHKGQIWVDKHTDQGTRMKFTLRRAEETGLSSHTGDAENQLTE